MGDLKLTQKEIEVILLRIPDPIKLQKGWTNHGVVDVYFCRLCGEAHEIKNAISHYPSCEAELILNLRKKLEDHV